MLSLEKRGYEQEDLDRNPRATDQVSAMPDSVTRWDLGRQSGSESLFWQPENNSAVESAYNNRHNRRTHRRPRVADMVKHDRV